MTAGRWVGLCGPLGSNAVQNVSSSRQKVVQNVSYNLVQNVSGNPVQNVSYNVVQNVSCNLVQNVSCNVVQNVSSSPQTSQAAAALVSCRRSLAQARGLNPTANTPHPSPQIYRNYTVRAASQQGLGHPC